MRDGTQVNQMNRTPTENGKSCGPLPEDPRQGNVQWAYLPGLEPRPAISQHPKRQLCGPHQPVEIE